MSDELVAFLRARLDEDERIARAAADYDDGAAHDVEGPPGTWSCLDEAQWFGPSYRGGVIAPRIGQANSPDLGAHIAEHDPARVLREIEAKRRMVAECVSVADQDSRGMSSMADDFLRLLALPYSDRPGYRSEWTP